MRMRQTFFQIGRAAIIVIILAATRLWALEWKEEKGYRMAPLPVPSKGHAGFSALASVETGIQFTQYLAYASAVTNQNLVYGSGVAAGDVDGDGLADLYFCNMSGRNALYHNLGNGRFEDVTEKSGVLLSNRFCTGAVFADVNGDGFLDLLVTSNGKTNVLFLNDGHGHFTDVSAASGVGLKGGSLTMTLADVDGDGALDLYVANYQENTILRGGGLPTVTYVNGQPQFSGRYRNRLKMVDGKMIELGEPDFFFRNDGRGHFKLVPWTDGTFLDEKGRPLASPLLDIGLSAMFYDINGDGHPDLYVCNDFQTPDRIWINDGRGHFRPVAREAVRQTSQFSMGIDFADINRDGYPEFILADMLSRRHELRMTQLDSPSPSIAMTGEPAADRPQIRRNTLFLNRRDGTFAEIANFAGVEASEWSWCPVFLDVDLDGYEDVLVINGNGYDIQDIDATMRNEAMRRRGQKNDFLKSYPSLQTANVAFRNRHDLTFEEVGREWGFDSKQVSNGMALVDLDNDGDLDVVVNCLNGPPLIYRNESTAPRVAVRLKGLPPNTRGIGAKIKLLGGAIPMQSQEMICGGRYLSGDDAMRVFAAGTISNRMKIEITWRTGKKSVLGDVRANYVYEIDEAMAEALGDAGGGRAALAGDAPAWFRDVSDQIKHTHHDEVFDDFSRQPLLPKKLSQLGPGVAWFDIENDGHEALIIGTGRGGETAVFRNDGRGHFEPARFEKLASPAVRDQTAIVGFHPAPGRSTLLIGSSNYEDADAAADSVLRFDLANGKWTTNSGWRVPGAVGPLALADYTGDGQLDLFVGGRVTAGRYPEPCSSHLYKNVNGEFVLDVENSKLLANVGLVSAAIFSDLNGDGQPDLILACEWGPVRIFLNDHGTFREATKELDLGDLNGWWTSIAVGDFDGDGRMDILAGNWGLNSSYRASHDHPARLYYGDFNGNGGVDLIEAYDELTPGKIVPRKNLTDVGAALPFVKEKFDTHKAYSAASVADILGDRLKKARELKADTLTSMVFLNRGNRFEGHALPVEAQFAPVFGMAVGDLDGDGTEDVFLAQNFFDNRADIPRLDAGRGLWLRGDGRGGFQPVSGMESGLKIYEEQRGAALCDFDGDGRVDLVVAQNGNATKLFQNTRAQPGLRIRLKGPAGNPDGIGAILQMMSGEKAGPAREIHAGSGYWSQDSTVQVMATGGATGVRVRWPGGKTTTSTLPSGAKDIVIDDAGILSVAR